MCPRVQPPLQNPSSPLAAGQAQYLDFLWDFWPQRIVLPNSDFPAFEMEKLSLRVLKQLTQGQEKKTEAEPRSPACPFPLL